MYICMYVCTYVCMCVCVCMYVCMCVCVSVCVYVYLCMSARNNSAPTGRIYMNFENFSKDYRESSYCNKI
jgi:hypothetical protein